MLCTLCKALPQNVPTDKRHERLQQVGLTERIPKEGKTKAAWITYYVCEVCDTKWRHIDDPANIRAGWSVQKHLVMPERFGSQLLHHVSPRRP